MFQLKFPHGSNTALIDGNSTLSFDDLHSLREIISSDFLNTIQGQPIRVLGCINDGLNAILALLTITELCDYMPINPQLTETEIQHIVQDSSFVDVAIVSSDLMTSYAKTLSKDIAVILDWDNIIERAKRKLEREKTTIQKDLSQTNLSLPKQGCLILHTSGSTGTPKRVPISLEAMNASAVNIAKSLQLTGNDLALNTLPTFHIGALVDVLLAPFHVGGSVSITSNRTPNELTETLIAIRPTWVQLVPTILRRLIEDISSDVLKDAGKSLLFVRCISAPLPPDLKLSAEALLGCPIIEMYGMTETAGQITSNSRNGLNKEGSVGQAGDAPVILLDNLGNAIESGMVGEVCVSGTTVFQGYEGMPKSNLFFDEWFRTGDLGEFDSDGYLFLRGRLKEMINVGGEKVSPLEIETAAVLHPDVIEAASYALPHPTLGEQVGLTIACSNESNLLHIAEHLKAHIADFKCPRKIIRVAELPRLPNAKIDRILLKRKGEEELLKRSLVTAHKVEASTAMGEVEKTIGRLWSKELKCRFPAENDDFFDMGGDSLSATSFLINLELTLGHKVSPSQLFETPTFESLVKHLTRVDEPKDKKILKSVTFVAQQMAGWPARAYLENGLFRGVGTLRTRNNLFWCVQSFDEFQRFSATLGEKRPLYITRSLYSYPKRCEQDFYDLAKALASEIMLIQPEGGITLGGFCGGGPVMHYVAERLEAIGRQVTMFLSFDYWINRPTSFPVLHVMSDSKKHSGRGQYSKHELALPVLHPRGSKVIQIDCVHNKFTPETLAPYLPIINEHIETKATFNQELATVQHPLWSYEERKKSPSAVIKIKTFSRFFKPGGKSRLSLTVQNTSSEEWPKTSVSGLSVAVRLLNMDMHWREHTAGYAEFSNSVKAQDEVKLSLDVHFPLLKLPFIVEILLSSQGVTNFHNKSSGRRLYFVMPKLF